ncbi:MAG: NADH:flavin oxidoreductase [Proteobacteria bacterium]|nr:NADH:flavin oxidoreductase [Pseudomonadota bacterium]
MWKPDARIRWQAQAGHAPSREEAAAARLFSRVRVGPLTLRQRTWVPAMVPWRASDDGLVTEDVLAWYERFARGQPGAIVIEATGIRDIPSGPLLRIGHDRFIPGLRQLADIVRRASDGKTRLFVQLIDFLSIRRRPAPDTYFARFLQVTDRHRRALDLADAPERVVRERLAGLPDDALDGILSPRECEDLRIGARERVTDMHLDHIRALPAVLPDLFAGAAQRARAAGLDGVELHFAHAYTMASFLSATNDRDDGYGGPRERRARLPLEVYGAVRAALGNDFVVGCRFLAEECIAGGSTLADSEYFAVAFARAGMDFLSTSRGGKFDDARQPAIGTAAYPYTGRSGYECMPQYISDEQGPFGRNAMPTRAIRLALRAAGCATPVVCTGGIHNFDMAEALLRDGAADIIGAARQSLADPDWTRKIALGLGDSVRRCEYTNYCEGLDQKHKQVTCQLWDRIDRKAPGVQLSHDGKRRLVPPSWDPPST